MTLLPGLALIVLFTTGMFLSVFRVRHRILLTLGTLGRCCWRSRDPALARRPGLRI
jgi:hypothetical protein